MTLLDPRDHPNDKYNVHLTNKAPAQMFSTIKFSTDQGNPPPRLTFDFPDRPDCATVALALSPAIPSRKGHDHDYSSGWC